MRFPLTYSFAVLSLAALAIIAPARTGKDGLLLPAKAFAAYDPTIVITASEGEDGGKGGKGGKSQSAEKGKGKGKG